MCLGGKQQGIAQTYKTMIYFLKTERHRAGGQIIGKFCGEAWDAISRYVYTALQGGSIMHRWTNDDRMMIACCNDGIRPVIFKIERIDIPETEEEKQWLEKQNFTNRADDAYTG